MRTLALAAALAAFASAQQGTVDPYTTADSRDLERAGYQGLGPFPIGGYHGTTDVDALLAPAKVRWLETAHFRIGTTLATYTIPRDQDQRRKLRDELDRLSSRLPTVDPKTTSLDPWLRTHLVAQRCEDVYADFQARLRVTDEDFPKRPGDVRSGEMFMGIGPYLGQKEKYVVLIFEHPHEVAAYSKAYLGDTFRWPQRYNFGLGRSLLFVTSPGYGGWLMDDTAMHAHLVYDVVQMLCDGYRNFGHDTPVWFKTGLAQWYGRKIDPRYPNFDRPPSGPTRSSTVWNWEPVAARLVRDGRATPMDEMATWRDYGPFRFEDFVVAWSRVEFLMEQFGDAGLRNFLFHFKDPLTLGRIEPEWELVLQNQAHALRDAYGFADWAAFDRSWAASTIGIAQAERPRRRGR